MDFDRDNELAELLISAQAGDRVAYEQFLLETSIILRPFLMKRINNIETVEDVLQDTLISIHRSRHSYLKGRPIGPWLYAICEHRMIDYFRRLSRIKTLEREDMETTFVEDSSERIELALNALAQLPSKQRKVIELLKLDEMSVKEASLRTGISESSVKVIAFRGYQAIRKILGEKKK